MFPHLRRVHSQASRGIIGSALFACYFGFGIGAWPAQARAQGTGPAKDEPERISELANAEIRADSGRVLPFTPLNGKGKFLHYLKSLYNPINLSATAAAAGIGQARDDVPEWGQQWPGYSHRLGSSYLKHVAKQTIAHSVCGLLGFDPRYFPSQRTGIWPRTYDAAMQSIRVRDDTGRWRFDYPHLISSFGAGFISRNTWYPQHYHTIVDGIKSGAITFALDAVHHVIQEFLKRGQ